MGRLSWRRPALGTQCPGAPGADSTAHRNPGRRVVAGFRSPSNDGSSGSPLLQTALRIPDRHRRPGRPSNLPGEIRGLVMAVQDSEYWSSDPRPPLLSLPPRSLPALPVPDSLALAQRMAKLQSYPGIGWLDPWPAGYMKHCSVPTAWRSGKGHTHT